MKKVVYLLILCFTILVGCETIDMIPNTKYAFSVSEQSIKPVDYLFVW